MAGAKKPNWTPMTETALANRLKEALVIFDTTAQEKFNHYRSLFTLLQGDELNQRGVAFHLLHSGELGRPASKTPEMNHDVELNGQEKAYGQMVELKNTEKSIRAKLKSKEEGQAFDPKKLTLMGMTEDSGWHVHFDNDQQKQDFVNAVIERLTPHLREQEKQLLSKLHEKSFPGPNLKPLMEAMGGFHKLITLIYDIAEEQNISPLRYEQESAITFVDPATNEYFTHKETSHGTLLPGKKYTDRLINVGDGVVVDSDFVQVPDGQTAENPLTYAEMKGTQHTLPASDFPMQYCRRQHAEWLREIIGSHQVVSPNTKPVGIAFVSPDRWEKEKKSQISCFPNENDFTIVPVPTLGDMKKYPTQAQFGAAKVISVSASKWDKEARRNLNYDPNYNYLVTLIVAAETDSASMGATIIIDNRDGEWDEALELLSGATVQGRRIGNYVLKIANTQEEYEIHLREAKTLYQSLPQTTFEDAALKPGGGFKEPIYEKDWNSTPEDDIPTILICGGHSNNNKRDLDQAFDYGYFCASQGWRLVTGGGVLEGSMGATYTGFIQYHLDQMDLSNFYELDREIQDKLLSCASTDKHGYDAESLIKDHRDVLEALADKNIIPRDMFYAFTTPDLVKAESHDGQLAAGVNAYAVPNIYIRLDELLKPDIKVILPGSIGTDQEFENILKQHQQEYEAAEKAGTPEQYRRRLIVYNVDGMYDSLLKHHKIDEGGIRAEARRNKFGVDIVTTPEELSAVTNRRTQEWTVQVNKQKLQEKTAVAQRA